MIRSPYYLENTEYPYHRGPIYTRPVFASQQNTASGNQFRVQPIIRMPQAGFGGALPAATYCGTQPNSTDATNAICMKFAALPDDQMATMAQVALNACVNQPGAKDASGNVTPSYSTCYWNSINSQMAAADLAATPAASSTMTVASLTSGWSSNPLIWGAGVLGLALVAWIFLRQAPAYGEE